MGKLFTTALIIFLALADPAAARHRVKTYIDENGVRRVQKTGKIYRDYAAVRAFKRTHPMPSDGRAYDIDHIKPLSKGGADSPDNMRWVTVEEHRRKTAGEKRQ